MADRHPHRGGVGGLRDRLPRHHRQAQGAPHLRGQLVLRRLHPRRRRVARRQQRGHPGEPVEVLLPVCRGADAMVQWWYGHNAVGFFLTAGFLGIMYYFVPRQAGRPVYSYRLSVVHFWSLIFTYIAGPAPTTALHRAARLGAVARDGDVADPARAVLGRDDQRHHDPLRRMGEAAHRSGAALPDRLGLLLRHVHFEGPRVDQDGERALPLPTDHRPRTLRWRSAGWRSSPSGAMYYLIPAPLRPRAVQPAPRRDAFLDLHRRHRVLHHLDVVAGIMQG